MYCKIETERLQFIRREQKALRTDSYKDLRDSILGTDADPSNEQEAYVNHSESKLTQEQCDIYDQLLTLINSLTASREINILFLDAPGGTGKTFLLNLLLAKIRATGALAISTASSGIAATLLTGGRTLHSMFKVPLDVQHMDSPTCAIKKGTTLSKIINDCKLILVDEAPMAHRAVYEAIDRSIRDIKGIDKLFGVIPTILCGDFRQILPVVKNGTRANVTDATLIKSHLWNNVKVLHLHTNMRAKLSNDKEAEMFASMLMSIGNGQYPITTEPDSITLPPKITRTNTADQLVKIQENATKPTWLLERTILAPLNETVNNINADVINAFCYYSVIHHLTQQPRQKKPFTFLQNFSTPLRFQVSHHTN
ncbi:ATP-dependent DNA helicase pif1-like [Lineus longissimus]|uniref:ATP-dependent DNA helicase pif1-like n=1 Tax=Lineus longissimus TaxID=88925 RepID=UPI00315CEF52